MRAVEVIRSDAEPVDTVTLDYESRYRRRIAMTGDGGTRFLLDLPETTELHEGDALRLEDGGVILVKAAPEPLMQATPRDLSTLAQVAWHVGNRHLPCEITPTHLTLRYDHVIWHMLEHLDCALEKLDGPFNPAGGAYGQGRTHGHDHGNHDHGHSHGHSHDHHHGDHSHSHD